MRLYWSSPSLGARSAPAGSRVATPVFDGAKEEEITGLLDSTLPTRDGERLTTLDDVDPNEWHGGSSCETLLGQS